MDLRVSEDMLIGFPQSIFSIDIPMKMSDLWHIIKKQKYDMSVEKKLLT